jgi:hypothetical protein
LKTSEAFAYVLVAIVVFGAARMSAQTTGTGTITGRVFDPSGGVIPGATVTARNVATGVVRQTIATAEGAYTLSALLVGEYEVSASHPGFRESISSGVVLSADSTVAVNITMQIGQTVETVQVIASPAQLDTQTSDISQIVSGKQVLDVPLNGRNFTQLLTLGTGVVSSQTGRRMGLGQEGNPLMSINGGPINGTQFTYDGVLAMDTGGNRGLNLFPPMEAIEEVQVHKSNYTADTDSYGYGQVNVITKSGGGRYSGGVYETFGNSALDAHNLNTGQVSPLRQNAFGYTLGGPVVAGHQKLFFFWSEAWNRRVGPQLDSYTTPPVSSYTATVMSPAMRAGDFSELLSQTPAITIVDPVTKAPFPGNRIPPDRLDRNALLLLNAYFPLPNAGANRYAFDTASETRWREELIRVDYNVNASTTIMGRYTQDSYWQQQDVLKPSSIVFPSIGATFTKPGKNAVVSLTSVLGSFTLNKVTFGYSRNGITIIPTAGAERPAGLTIPSIFGSNSLKTVPSIQIGNGYSPLQFTVNDNVNPVFTLRDDFKHQAGSHAVSAGFAFIRTRKNDAYPVSNQQGTFNFAGGGTGYGPSNFLLGLASSYTESTGQIPEYFHTYEAAEYVQDDWTARPNLTLNLGLRVEQFPAQNIGPEDYGNISNFVPALYNPARAPTLSSNGQLVPGTGDLLNGIITPGNQKGLSLPPSLLKPRNYNWGPRVGFAWSPGGSSTPMLVVRGGYGIFYTWANSNHETLSSNPPFTRSGNFGSTTLDNPGAGVGTLAPPNLQAFDVLGFDPMVQHWSVSVERRLPFDAILAVAYVGNHATHVDQTININQPPAGSVNGAINVNTVRPYRGYGTIMLDTRNGTSRYNGLQVHARRPFTKGQLIEVSYTWSRALQTLVGQDHYLRQPEQGPTNYDRTHVLTINYFYSLPFLRDRDDILGRTLGGWQVGGLTTFETGAPFTVTLTGDPAQVGVGNTTERPNLVAPVTYPKTATKWFSTGSFALPASGTFGNEGLNALRGPGLEYWSLVLLKEVPLGGGGGRPVRVQFAAEFHNLLNHANPENVDATYGGPTFGAIRMYLDPRNIDFRVRISF